MNMLPFHPAPSSVGELLPGQWSIPNNPISDAHSIAAADQVSYRARIGELMPARFSTPQNPLMRELSGCSSLRGCGCGSGGCEVGLVHGMEGFSDTLQEWADKFTASASSLFTGADWTTWAMVGGGLVLAYMVLSPGGSQYRGKREALQKEQAEERRGLRRQYRGYRRAARSIAA